MVNGFSVIMPTYNQAYFIRRAVMSLIRQSYPQWELIIVNDGSTDATDRIISGCHRMKESNTCIIRIIGGWDMPEQRVGHSTVRTYCLSSVG